MPRGTGDAHEGSAQHTLHAWHPGACSDRRRVPPLSEPPAQPMSAPRTSGGRHAGTGRRPADRGTHRQGRQGHAPASWPLAQPRGPADTREDVRQVLVEPMVNMVHHGHQDLPEGKIRLQLPPTTDSAHLRTARQPHAIRSTRCSCAPLHRRHHRRRKRRWSGHPAATRHRKRDAMHRRQCRQSAATSALFIPVTRSRCRDV